MNDTTKQPLPVSEEELLLQKQYAAQVRALLGAEGKPHFVYIETFGCQQNEADSERLLGMACEMGYEVTDVSANADLLLVNTCAVREHAELKALSITGQFKHLKAKNPQLLIGICGCMVSQEHRKADIKNKYPYIDFLFGTSLVYRFPQILYETMSGHCRKLYADEAVQRIAEDLPVRRASKTQAWVSIMYGCNNFCTYCVVPYVRGRERSRSAEKIEEEVRALVQGGCREVTLLGQNVNSYHGADCPDFPTLLHRICTIEGDFTVRFMTSHPKDASAALIDCMASEKKIARQFHLPLQSGSSKTLRRMNRRYTKEQYLALADALRKKIPDLTLTTDIIVGFPGESEEDFEQTLDVLQRVRFDSIFSFLYSPRRGTPAADYPDQIDPEVKKERFRRLTDLQNEISLEKNREMIGKVLPVFVQGQSKTNAEMFSGRTEGNKLVHFKAAPQLIGKTVPMKITDATFFALFAEPFES